MVLSWGLGGTSSSFDSIALDVVANSSQTAAQSWPTEDRAPLALQTEIAEQLTKELSATTALFVLSLIRLIICLWHLDRQGSPFAVCRTSVEFIGRHNCR